MKGAVLDLDGTVYRSEREIPGAAAAVAELRADGIDVVFVSNTSTKSRRTCAERLARLGIDAAVEDVLTSASVTATYVADEHPDDAVLAIGGSALFDELDRAGVSLTDEPGAADVLVVGKDRSFDFDTLTLALRALDDGTTFVVTNRDRAAPTADGLTPGTGAIVGAVVGATGREPDVVVGKPHQPMIEATLDHLDLAPSDCLVVGDNLRTDVAMGARAGMVTALVSSGVAPAAGAAERDVVPDHTVESLAAIGTVLDRVRRG